MLFSCLAKCLLIIRMICSFIRFIVPKFSIKKLTSFYCSFFLQIFSSLLKSKYYQGLGVFSDHCILCSSYTKYSLAMTTKHLSSVKNNKNRNRFWYALDFHYCVFKDFYHFNSMCMCVHVPAGTWGDQRFWIPWELVTDSCKLSLIGAGN